MYQKSQHHFLKFSIHLSVRKSPENYRQIYGKSKASLWRNLSTGKPPIFFQDNPLLYNFRLQLIFLSEQSFYGNYSTLDSQTNTVISHTFAYSSGWRRKPYLLTKHVLSVILNSLVLRQLFYCSTVWSENNTTEYLQTSAIK